MSTRALGGLFLFAAVVCGVVAAAKPVSPNGWSLLAVGPGAVGVALVVAGEQRRP